MSESTIEEMASLKRKISLLLRKISLLKEHSERMRTPLVLEVIESSNLAKSFLMESPAESKVLLEMLTGAVSRPVTNTTSAERKSRMTYERELERLGADITEAEYAYDWMPEWIDQGDGSPYFLFTPEVHRKWMAKAEQVTALWVHLEDDERFETVRMLWLLKNSYVEGYDSGDPTLCEDNPHLVEQGEARSEERDEIFVEKIRPMLEGDMTLMRLKRRNGKLSDIWMRQAAVQYELHHKRSDDPDSVAEHRRLCGILGIEDPNNPWRFFLPPEGP